MSRLDHFNRWLCRKMKGALHTRRCVRCGDKATCFTGHVLLGPVWVISGWCESHRADSPGWNYSFRFGRLGCAGLWWPWYGIWIQRWKLQA